MRGPVQRLHQREGGHPPTPFTAPKAIEYDLDFYREHSDTYLEQGWEVFILREEPEDLENGEEFVDGAFARDGTFVAHSSNGLDDTPRQQALAQAEQTASRIIAKLNSAPAASDQARYPVPHGDVPDPCEVFAAEDSLNAPGAGLRRHTFKSERIARMNFDSHRDPESVFSVCEGPAEPFDAVVGDAPAQLGKGGGDAPPCSWSDVTWWSSPPRTWRARGGCPVRPGGTDGWRSG